MRNRSFGTRESAQVVPLLAVATDLDHKTALGTSLCAMVPTGVAGVLAHHRLGHVKLVERQRERIRTAGRRYCTSFPTGRRGAAGPRDLRAFAGGRLASHLDEEPMRVGFGGVMVVLGLRALFKKV